MAEKRKRGQNFSSKEKEKLVNLLRDHRDTILNKRTDGTTNEAKALAWANLTIKFNSSNNYPRTKDSLMKLWEKMKTEAKLNKNENKNCNTGTGGGPNTSKYDPVLEQTCDLMGRGCTGILGVNDSDATTNQIQVQPIPEHIQPIVITLDQPFTEDSIEIGSDCEETAKKTKIGGEDGGNTNSITDHATGSSLLKTPLWARRRRPQLSSKNERSESYTGLLSSYKDVNVRKLDAEDLKLQLLQEEICFKQELHKRQLEEIGLKQDLLKIEMETASCELEIRKEVLSQVKGCLFPAQWHGRWFQSGVIQSILIEGDRLSNKGKCLSSEGDKFLIVDEKGCYRCVVMHEKHKNVLQYKETFCHRRDALPHLCSLITGDALLYSMFRENADPVDCPLKGPFSFTYNRGHGDCKSPVSSIESCTEDSRLLLNYQACPDVHGSESTVEELECLATWKEGSLRFLVGKIHHNHATSNEDRYRCFVYEKTNGISSNSNMREEPVAGGVEYRVAQSGDATCNGLFSASDGSRTMALKRVPVRFNCQFPAWMTFSHTWHTLDFSSNYTFQQRNASLRISNYTFQQRNVSLRVGNQPGGDVKVSCVHVKASSPSGNSVALVAHWQHHCVSRFVCVVLYRRDKYIAELQRGAPTLRPDDACSPHHFNAAAAPYITLVASSPETKECPYPGKYTIEPNRRQRSARSIHASERDSAPQANKSKRDKAILEHNRRFNRTRVFNFSVGNMSEAPMLRSRRQTDEENACVSSNYNRLEVGCNTVKTMEFYSNCENKEMVTAYTCHGGWYEDGASFVVTTPVTRDSTAARRYCFVSRESRASSLTVTRSAANCERGKGEGSLLFTTAPIGECQDVSNSQQRRRLSASSIFISITIALLNLFTQR